MKSNTAPFLVLWEITNKCNFRCPYCHAEVALREKKKIEDLKFSDLLLIADKLISAKIFSIILTGGEPLIRADEILKIAEYLRRNKISVSIISNGHLLTGDIAEKCSELGIMVGISLDASSEEIQAKTRGAGSFIKAVNAVKLLKKHNVVTNIVCTLTRHNFDDLENLFAMIEKFALNSVAVQSLTPFSDIETYRRLKLTAGQEKGLPEKVANIEKRFSKMFINWNEVLMFARHFMPDRVKGEPGNRLMSGCSACERTAIIGAEGMIYPCPSMRSMPFGNLLADDIRSLWSDSDSARFVHDIKRKTTGDMPGCTDCPLKGQCNGGCRPEAYLVHGDWYALHDRCPMRTFWV